MVWVADAGVVRQDAVFYFCFEECQPVLDGGIGFFQDACVAILQIYLPGQGNADAAPNRAAAGWLGMGRGKGQVAVGNLLVPPVLQPFGEKWTQVEIDKSHFHGRA